MKSWIKKLLCAALCLLLTVSLLPFDTQAAVNVTGSLRGLPVTVDETHIIVDPYYERNYPELIARVRSKLEARTAGVRAEQLTAAMPMYAPDYAATQEAAAAELLAKLKEHAASIAVTYQAPLSSLDTAAKRYAVMESIWALALGTSLDPAEGDYVRRSIEAFTCSISFTEDGTTGFLSLVFQPYYWGGLTESQEEEMAAAVDEVLESFHFTPRTSNYDKIHLIYHWITENIDYDFAALEDTEEGWALQDLDQTAYSAIMNRKTVCGGFSHLLYYMLWKSQVPARILVGYGGTTGNMEPHAWNMVWFRGAWYSLDVTWDEDSTYGLEQYFLRGRDTDFYKKSSTTDYHLPEGPDSDNDMNVGLDCSALVRLSSLTDYGGRLAADDTACDEHTQADTTYVTDSGGTVYWCSVCAHTQFNSFDSVELKAPELVSVTEVSGGIEFKWNAVRGAANYRVYRKTGSGSWNRLVETDDTSITDKNVTAGKTYTYTVRAKGADGKLSGYNKTGLTLKYTGSTKLAAPELVSVTMKSTGVQFKWKAVDGAVKYRVYRKVGSGSWKYIGATSKTSYTNKKVTAGTTYSYTVRAVDTAGKLSAYDKTGLTLTYISVPELVSVKKVSSGVKFTWKASDGAVKYSIYRKTDGGKWKYLAQTSRTYYTDKRVAVGSTYAYTVRGKDAYGHLSAYNTTGKSITISIN